MTLTVRDADSTPEGVALGEVGSPPIGAAGETESTHSDRGPVVNKVKQAKTSWSRETQAFMTS